MWIKTVSEDAKGREEQQRCWQTERCFSTWSSWTHVFTFPIKSPTHQARLTWKDGFCGRNGVNFTRWRTEMAVCKREVHFSVIYGQVTHQTTKEKTSVLLMEAVYWNELNTVDLKTCYIYRSVHLGHKRSYSNHPKCMFDGAIASGFSKYYGNCKKVKHHSLTRKVYMTFRHCSKTWAKWILGLHGTFKWSPHFSTFNVFASHTIIYTIELLGEKN